VALSFIINARDASCYRRNDAARPPQAISTSGDVAKAKEKTERACWLSAISRGAAANACCERLAWRINACRRVYRLPALLKHAVNIMATNMIWQHGQRPYGMARQRQLWWRRYVSRQWRRKLAASPASSSARKVKAAVKNRCGRRRARIWREKQSGKARTGHGGGSITLAAQQASPRRTLA